MAELAHPGDFCPYDECPEAGLTDADNIVKYGLTPQGKQRFRCTTCGKTFCETTGTVFYKKQKPDAEIIETLALVAEGVRVASLSRVKGFKEETIRNWLRQAAEQAEAIERVLMDDYQVSEGQLDALWSYVGRKQTPERNTTEGATEGAAVGRGAAEGKKS
jgi:transposase-like protein